MKPPRFGYQRASSVAEAVSLLASFGEEGKILAGGQSLVPALNMRLARPAQLVDINRVPDLDHIRSDVDGGLTIGALVRHTDLANSTLVRERAPLLAEAARHIGHRAIRNRGTVGGSLAHADPAAELPAVMVALEATLVVAGPAGTRTITAESFFQGMYVTALEPGELLVEVRLPGTSGSGWAFAELARRPGDFAMAGVACLGQRLVAFGVGDAPVRLRRAEAVARAVQSVEASVAAEVGRAAAAECDPPADIHASAAYRRHLVEVLTEQVLVEATARLPDQAHAGQET